MSCGVGCRWGLDPMLLWLWLWHRPAAAAPIKPLAWEPPYAASAALKRRQKKKKVNVRSRIFQGLLGVIHFLTMLTFYIKISCFLEQF